MLDMHGVPHISKVECLTIALSPRDSYLNDARGYGWPGQDDKHADNTPFFAVTGG
jgi:hypothetical protein